MFVQEAGNRLLEKHLVGKKEKGSGGRGDMSSIDSRLGNQEPWIRPRDDRGVVDVYASLPGQQPNRQARMSARVPAANIID